MLRKLAIASCLCLVATLAQAQDKDKDAPPAAKPEVAPPAGTSVSGSVLRSIYGRGVHEYNSKDFKAAEGTLTDAVDGGTVDPRAYYFRGATRARMGGKGPGAENDFTVGADFEAIDVSKQYRIGQSLERVQGNLRVAIEEYRKAGKVRFTEKREAEHKARYGEIMQNEPEVLRVPAKPYRIQHGNDPFADEPGQLPAGKAPAPKGEDLPPKE
jgi:hypothetical protein